MNILIHKNDEQHGRFSVPELEEALAAGTLSPDDFAWAEGQTDGIPLKTLVPALAPKVANGGRPPLPVAAPVPTTRISGTIAKLITDEQDPAVVQKILTKAQELLTRGEQMMGATITCVVTNGLRLSIDCIPKKQARRIYSYA